MVMVLKIDLKNKGLGLHDAICRMLTFLRVYMEPDEGRRRRRRRRIRRQATMFPFSGETSQVVPCLASPEQPEAGYEVIRGKANTPNIIVFNHSVVLLSYVLCVKVFGNNWSG
jgi:hypothetical protein